MRYLGIDYGEKHIGIALSDEAGTMGFPHMIVANDKQAVDRIVELMKEQSIGAVVVGESRDFSGVENKIAEKARAFGDRLLEVTGVPVTYELEALTTQEARRDLEGNRSITGRVDAAAAALILTSYLSRRHDTH